MEVVVRSGPSAALAALRQHRTLRLQQNSLFCDVAKVRKTIVALIGNFATQDMVKDWK